MNKHLAASSLAVCCGLVQAHAGHGLPGNFHWHAGDALVLLGLAALAAVGLWLARKP